MTQAPPPDSTALYLLQEKGEKALPAAWMWLERAIAERNLDRVTRWCSVVRLLTCAQQAIRF